MNSFTPIEVSLARLRTLVSPHVGVVRELQEQFLQPDDVRLVHIHAEVSNPEIAVGFGSTFLATGSAATSELAEVAALGEAAERYSGLYVPAQSLTVGTADELDSEAIGPHAFSFFAEAQYAEEGFPYVPFLGSTRVAWVRAVSLGDGRQFYLPAQVVFRPPAPLAGGEERVTYSTTSGMACGATSDEATLRALLEVIERDAVMVSWYARLTLPILDTGMVESFPVAESIRRTGHIQCRLVDLSSISNVPTVLAAIRQVGETPHCVPFALGAASAPTVEGAATKALGDAFRLRPFLRVKRAQHGDVPPRRDQVADFHDHALFYAYAENAGHTAFLDRGPLVNPPMPEAELRGNTPAELLRNVVARLTSRGVDVYAVDVTAPDVRSAGLRVVRVVCPRLASIDMGYRYRFLGHPRLRTAPRALGLRKRVLAMRQLNSWPHPFP